MERRRKSRVGRSREAEKSKAPSCSGGLNDCVSRHGRAEIAALTTQLRSLRDTEAAALTTATTPSGFAAIAALNMHQITCARMARGLSSQFFPAAWIATPTILEARSGRRLVAAMTIPKSARLRS